MTARDIFTLAGKHPLVLIAAFALPPLIALLLRWAHDREGGGRSPYKYIYAALIYLVSIPGMLAAVVTSYALFFTSENLLDVNLLVYVLPIVSMVLTLILISRNVELKQIPSVERLSGLMLLIGLTFVIVLAVYKTRIWLFFGGSILTLVVIAAFIFALLKWGAHMAFRRRDDDKQEPPDMPSFD